MANLITLATYKELQHINNSNHDFVLSSFIDSVSQLVKTYCNNTFVDYFNTPYTEVFTIDYAKTFVQLRESPLCIDRTVVNGEQTKPIIVRERPSLQGGYVTLVDNVDFYADYASDSIYRVTGNAYSLFPLGPGSVEITYYAGYQETPQDLKLAVMDLVTYYHKEQSKQRQSLAGASITNVTSSSQKNAVDFPDHIKRVLDLHKQFA